MTIASVEWDSPRIRDITSRLDPALPRLLDLYQISFPLPEQLLVSFFLDWLEQKEVGGVRQFHLDVLAHEREVAGFAIYSVSEEVEDLGRGGYLWFLASHPDLRGKGIGKRLYAHVRDQIFLVHGGRGLFFEIEDGPETLERHGPEAAAYAEWRKAWYKRQGAFELRGTRYIYSAGWQPAVLLQPMVHPNGPLTADQALVMARHVQNSGIERIDGVPMELRG